MYRLVLYGLIAITLYALALSALGIIGLPFLGLIESLGLLLIACGISHYVLVWFFNAAASRESVWITSLILFLTIAPPTSVSEGMVIALTGILAMTSKYVFAWRTKHVFNPAAISLLLISLLGSDMATWWVGTTFLAPIVAIVGLLIVRKIRRFDLLFAFLFSSTAVSISTAVVKQLTLSDTLLNFAISGPLIFFSTIMLTEPLTMPPSRGLRIVYGITIGTLFSSQFHNGILSATPEFALVVGNLYAYFVSSKQKLVLALQKIEQLSANVYEFVFKPNEPLQFLPGQYMEWTLPHTHADNRGNRRYFTIASSPLDADIRLGVRIDPKSSSFKKALRSLPTEGTIVASSLSGDFTLPANKQEKLVFIAGGVGITPFTSMLRTLIARQEKRNIILFYAAASAEDFAYHSLVEQAYRELGIKTIYISGQEKITAELLQREVPDASRRTFFISGPDGMVRAYKKFLADIGIPRRNIHTDYFPGF